MAKIIFFLYCFVFLEMKAMDVHKKKVATAGVLVDLSELNDTHIFLEFLQKVKRDYDGKKKSCLKKKWSKSSKKIKLKVSFRLLEVVK